MDIKNTFKNTLDFLLPPSCGLCRAPLQTPHNLCGACWQKIDFITPPICQRLGIPMPIDLGEETLSLAALFYPPPYGRARSAFHYHGAGAELVRAFKFRDQTQIATILARFMENAGRDVLTREAGERLYLVPVPLHRNRLLARRYNQAAELCRALVRLVDIEPLYGALIRRRATPQQVGLTRAMRKNNLSGAFFVPSALRETIKGARLILVDDVITTASTAEICTQVLLRAGAERVDVLSAARVVMPERPQYLNQIPKEKIPKTPKTKMERV